MLEPEKLFRFEAELVADARVIPSLVEKREDHVTHAGGRVLPARSVVADRRCHALTDVAVDDNDRQHPAGALADVLEGEHDQVPVEPVDNHVSVSVMVINGDNWLRVAVLFNREVQEPHFVPRYAVRIVVVRLDLLDWYPLHGAHRVVMNHGPLLCEMRRGTLSCSLSSSTRFMAGCTNQYRYRSLR